MNILVKKRVSADKMKIWYSFEWGIMQTNDVQQEFLPIEK